MNEFGERIREERKRLGLGQAEFGKIGGCGRTTQFKYESGESKPDIDYLTALHKFGVDAFYIMTGQRIDQTKQGEHQLQQYASVEEAVNAVIDLQTDLGVTFSGDQLKQLISLAWTAQLNRAQLKASVQAAYKLMGQELPQSD
jgi:transcriptional regulator with XRE-family HTH domain